MKTAEITLTSLLDLDRKKDAFIKSHPLAIFADESIQRERAHAVRMDNDGRSVGAFVTFKFQYALPE